MIRVVSMFAFVMLTATTPRAHAAMQHPQPDISPTFTTIHFDTRNTARATLR